MPFRLIKGTYHVVGTSPDGDTIRFRPDNLNLVKGLGGSPPDLKGRDRDMVNLRIEAIDSLETHYNPPGSEGTLHQPLALAHAAGDRLLQFLRITEVEWDSAHQKIVSARDGTRGYILSRTIEKNGRPVAFVYEGDPAADDGAEVRLDQEGLEKSFNLVAITEGHAYPTFYEGLFHDLRDALARAAKGARERKSGVYATDDTARFEADSLKRIMDDHVILPKLFRRLSEYMVKTGTTDGFKAMLARSKEPVLDLRTNNFTHLDTFVEQRDGSPEIQLTVLPEQLVFDPMPARPVHVFTEALERSGEDAHADRIVQVPESTLHELLARAGVASLR